MKNLSAFLILVMTIFLYSCTASVISPLKDYQPRNSDEQQIIGLIFEYQNGMNLYDPERVYAVYAPDASIQMTKKNGSLLWHIVTKEEYMGLGQERLNESYIPHKLKFEFFVPDKVNIAGTQAVVTIPYRVHSTVPWKTASGNTWDYWEKGLFNLEFTKSSAWLINKHRWEVKDTNHPKFEEYLEWKKRK